MTDRSLILPITCGGRIIAHLQGCFPEEGCGLIVGRETGDGWLVTEVVPSPNKAEARDRTFEIDPGLRLRTQRTARQRGDAVLGHYHSHPYGDPVPSETDMRRAADEPELLWVVVGMRWGGTQGLAAWQRDVGSVTMKRVMVDVIEGAGQS